MSVYYMIHIGTRKTIIKNYMTFLLVFFGNSKKNIFTRLVPTIVWRYRDFKKKRNFSTTGGGDK